MRTFFLFFLFAFATLQADAAKKTVCLNMIVKDESAVIEQCLETVKPLIDYWIIVDTGSTDGTQDLIRKCLKGIPGELHEKPWVNFAHNRNEALELARNKADYLLMIDADEMLQFADDFVLPELDKDVYYMVVRQVGAVDFRRATLISTELDWKWHGVLHEVLHSDDVKSFGLLTKVMNVCNSHDVLSGRSKDPEKYLNDAKILEKALQKEPDNSRYVFYLAQSYYAAHDYKSALKNYQKRAEMPSDDLQETFFAIYNAGKLLDLQGDVDGAIKSFFKAYEFRPTRSEPLFQAAVAYRKQGNTLLGYLLTKYALSLPYPPDSCVEYAVYDHTLLIEFANCALLLGRLQEGLDASLKLLENPNLPPDVRPRVVSNCEFARSRLAALAAMEQACTCKNCECANGSSRTCSSDKCQCKK